MLLKITGKRIKAYQTILAGDVGATKTNLAIFSWNGTSMSVQKEASCKSKAYKDLHTLRR